MPQSSKGSSLMEALRGLAVGQRLRVLVGPDDGAVLPDDGTRSVRLDSPLLSEQVGEICMTREDEARDGRTLQLSWSSEEPYPRWWGVEVLGHDPGEVDLTWLASGRAPLLVDHDTREQIGVVESAQISRRRGTAVVRLGVSERAEREWRDVQAGVRTSVSVGYEVRELELTAIDGELRTYRVTDWRPLEISLVAVPADTTVGVGRSIPVPESAAARGVREMSETHTRAADTAPIVDHVQAATAATQAERLRARQIRELAGRHSMGALGEQHVESGTSIEEFRGVVLAELDKRGQQAALYSPAVPDLTQREVQKYSLARLILSTLPGGNPSQAGFEREVAHAIRAAQDQRGVQGHGGLCVPLELLASQQRDLTVGAGPGSQLVGTQLLADQFSELLRPTAQVLAMGATSLPGLVGNVSIPRQTGTVTMGWVGQGVGAAESDSAFALVNLTPRTAAGIQDVTREMLLQGTPAIEQLVREDLLGALSTAIDTAALHGAGGVAPTGLAGTAGIAIVDLGANGAAPTWDHVVELESRVANANSLARAAGYLTNSRVRGRLKRTLQFAAVGGAAIWGRPLGDDPAATFGEVNGYRAAVSNNASHTLTKGTSAGVCSAIFFGGWPDLLIGQWGSPEILVDQFTQAASRVVRMHVYQTIDVGVRRPGSFSAILDALTV